MKHAVFHARSAYYSFRGVKIQIAFGIRGKIPAGFFQCRFSSILLAEKQSECPLTYFLKNPLR